jgi:ketosteroid isomerase-like protein
MGKHEEDVVKRWLTTVKGSADQRWPGMLENWHADATWHLIGKTHRSGIWRGLEGPGSIQEFMSRGRYGDGRPGPSVQGLSSEYGIRLEVDEVVSLVDGRVLVLCRSYGSGRNGVPYENEYAWLFTVRGDKIAALEEYCDTLTIEEAHFDKELVPRGTTQPVYET